MPVDLRGAEEPDVNPVALEPVREHLRHRHDRVGGLGQLAVADRQRRLVGFAPIVPTGRPARTPERASGVRG